MPEASFYHQVWSVQRFIRFNTHRTLYLRAPLKTIIFLGDLYFMVAHSYLLIGLKPLMRAAFQ